MTTQAAVFIPIAAGQIRQVIADLERVQNDATHLYLTWSALGKATMGGWDDVNLWATFPFTAVLLAEAVEDLSVAHTGEKPTDESAALVKLLKILQG
jgi:hypothetical protein